MMPTAAGLWYLAARFAITPREVAATPQNPAGGTRSTPQTRTPRDLHIILICQQGYQSSLAAATLQQLGLVHATDLDGGFTGWAAAGLPVIASTAARHDPAGNRSP